MIDLRTWTARNGRKAERPPVQRGCQVPKYIHDIPLPQSA